MKPLFAIACLLAAFCMSSIQPLLGKMLLPSYGGSNSVWTTAMLFFQSCLLIGYLYAYLLSRFTTPLLACIIHATLWLLAFLTLPFSTTQFQTESLSKYAALELLINLISHAAFPLTLLGASAPLLQWWFANTQPKSDNPYSLYIASNVGTLAGLLSYPLLIEPSLGLQIQSKGWLACWILLTLILSACIWVIISRRSEIVPNNTISPMLDYTPNRMRWLFLSFIPSSMMLAITTKISQELPPMPLLWLGPLLIYMLTFILAFLDWKQKLWNLVLWANALALILQLSLTLGAFPIAFEVLAFFWLLSLLLVGLVCHGLLYQSRPPVQYLTEFYLWLAAGGFLGGVFQALIAPTLFPDLYEFWISLALAAFTIPNLPWLQTNHTKLDHKPLRWIIALAIAVAIFLLALQNSPYKGLQCAVFLVLIPYLPRPILFGIVFSTIVFIKLFLIDAIDQNLIFQERSFYGVHRVSTGTNQKVRWLYHGITEHGAQIISELGKPPYSPLVYYHPFGPAGQILLRRTQLKNMEPIGVVGLGAGSLAWYAASGQKIDFFEIDPMVARIASNKKLFTYLPECKGHYHVKLGDARTTLKQEPDSKFGILILDAFSSDAIPVHLLTKEAIQTFVTKLQDDGVLLFHISNRHLDLRPQLNAVAKELGLVALVQNQGKDKISEREEKSGLAPSMWVIMCRNPKTLADQIIPGKWTPLPNTPFQLWTDDFSCVLNAWR